MAVRKKTPPKSGTPKRRSYRKKKSNLGATPDGNVVYVERRSTGVTPTPERVFLYAIGVMGIFGLFYIGNQYFKSLQARADKADELERKRLEERQQPTTTATTTGGGGGTPASLPSQPAQPSPNTLPSTTTPTTQVVFTQQQSDVIIPPVSSNRFWGGVNAAPDTFPLNFGKGGLRVLELQEAFKRLGWGIQNPTGYFYTVTRDISRARLGTENITEQTYVDVIRRSRGLAGLEPEQNILSYIGLIAA